MDIGKTIKQVAAVVAVLSAFIALPEEALLLCVLGLASGWYMAEGDTVRVLVTAAALIMMLVFAAQIFASVAIIKQFGLGLALAIFIDATLVRALVVPSTMRLMGTLNWWAPSFLQRKKNNDSEE